MKYEVIVNEKIVGEAQYKYIIEADSEDDIRNCIKNDDFLDFELLDSDYYREEPDSFEIVNVKQI